MGVRQPNKALAPPTAVLFDVGDTLLIEHRFDLEAGIAAAVGPRGDVSTLAGRYALASSRHRGGAVEACLRRRSDGGRVECDPLRLGAQTPARGFREARGALPRPDRLLPSRCARPCVGQRSDRRPYRAPLVPDGHERRPARLAHLRGTASSSRRHSAHKALGTASFATVPGTSGPGFCASSCRGCESRTHRTSGPSGDRKWPTRLPNTSLTLLFHGPIVEYTAVQTSARRQPSQGTARSSQAP